MNSKYETINKHVYAYNKRKLNSLNSIEDNLWYKCVL